MLSIVGTYQNGNLKLDKDFQSENPVKVIVTFLENVEAASNQSLSLNDFSFSSSQKNLESCKGSFSDAVIEERQRDL
jgi:hypothetical protein